MDSTLSWSSFVLILLIDHSYSEHFRFHFLGESEYYESHSFSLKTDAD